MNHQRRRLAPLLRPRPFTLPQSALLPARLLIQLTGLEPWSLLLPLEHRNLIFQLRNLLYLVAGPFAPTAQCCPPIPSPKEFALPPECPVSEFVLPWHYCATQTHPLSTPLPQLFEKLQLIVRLNQKRLLRIEN